jgi:formylglycine-generating enzyme required for sulfatase activity
MQGVPCNAGLTVGMTYQMDADGKNIRQLSFDQDHNYNPTVMNDGRVLYLRWEYTDIPHVWARYLFTMNPDGTDQRAYYKSGSYWPNSTFYTRPIPGHPTRVVGVITGHHVGRVGELVVFDPARARTGTEGVVQKIPGYGKKVEPLIQDKLTLNVYPKFLHPYPLNEKYFLVASKPAPESLWGIYLVDVFDNMTLIREEEGYALLEPVPFRKTARPPVIPERVDPARNDALAYIANVYNGPGLKGVPRGAVKSLRLYTYHFGYSKLAGINHRVGADGPWEPKQVLGTVPVEKDGSAYFRVPARTPISIQPLDENGRALQLMRSWMTAMPGEFVSCNGCHESQSLAAVNRDTIAIRRDVSEIKPWRGEPRGFDFAREVQPVLDRHCVGCHNGSPGKDGRTLADLRGNQGKLVAFRNGDPVAKIIPAPAGEADHKKYGGIFEPAYIEMRRYVRASGLESDLRGLHPGEFHANTTELVQMLEAGHYGVKLDAEAWDRVNTWIDLNTPAHGTWHETIGHDRVDQLAKRRADLQQLYAGFRRADPEAPPPATRPAVEPIVPKLVNAAVQTVKTAAWPFGADEAKRRQATLGTTTRTLDLGGVSMEMVLVPAGEFVMGDAEGYANEKPLSVVRIDRPFWMGKFEITNEQWAKFDAAHDSRYEHKGSWKFNEWDLGWPLNGLRQPVIRVSQQEAAAFCRWLSGKTNLKVELPTEAQWEYACRAGSAAPLSYGAVDADFSRYANLADYKIRDLVYDVRDQYPPDLVPREPRFNDGKLVTADVGSFLPNAWGLHDMHGNAWEWTRTALRPYPYSERDGRNAPAASEQVVARGGSWYDRPRRARAGFRLAYPQWQKVYNVGLRVVIEAEPQRPYVAGSRKVR